MHEKVFGDHPLSWAILGYDETVKNLSRDVMDGYFRRRYAPENLILFVAGRVDPDDIVATAERSVRMRS